MSLSKLDECNESLHQSQATQVSSYQLGMALLVGDIDAQKIDSITVLLLSHYFILFLNLAHITLTRQDSYVCPISARHSLKFDSCSVVSQDTLRI